MKKWLFISFISFAPFVRGMDNPEKMTEKERQEFKMPGFETFEIAREIAGYADIQVTVNDI